MKHTKKDLKKMLFRMGYPYRVLNEFSKSELEKLLKYQNKRGGMFGDFLKSFDTAYPVKKPFQIASNMIRSELRNSGYQNVRNLEYGEMHPTIYNPGTRKFEAANYCGPGTRIDIHGKYPPFNVTDAICQAHDFDYKKASEEPNSAIRERLIRDADERMRGRLRAAPSDELMKYLADAGIGAKIKIENLLPKQAITKTLGPNYYGKK